MNEYILYSKGEIRYIGFKEYGHLSKHCIGFYMFVIKYK